MKQALSILFILSATVFLQNNTMDSKESLFIQKESLTEQMNDLSVRLTEGFISEDDATTERRELQEKIDIITKQLNDLFIFLKIENKNYTLENNHLLVQSDYFQNVKRFNTRSGTLENPLTLEDISYDSFDALVKLIIEKLSINDFDFDEYVALAQLVDYFQLVGQKEFDLLMFDLGKKLKENSEKITLLREDLQVVCNTIINYFESNNPIDYEKIKYVPYASSYGYDFFCYLRRNKDTNSVFEEIYHFITNNLKIDLRQNEVIFIYIDNFLEEIKHLSPKLNKDEYPFKIARHQEYYPIIKIIDKNKSQDIINGKKVYMLKNVYEDKTPYKYIFIGFINAETGEIIRFF